MSETRVEGQLELRDLQRMMKNAGTRNTPNAPRVNLSVRPITSFLVLVGLEVALMVLYRWLRQNDAGSLMIVMTALLLGLLGIVILVMIAALWFTHAGPRALAKQPGVLGPRSYVIEDEGLRVTTEVSDSLTRWRAISEVASDDDYLFLYVGNILGPLVPRRFFDNDDQFHDFADELRRRVAEASDTDPPRADLPKAVASIKRDDD